MKNKSPLLIFLSILMVISFIFPLCSATITPILNFGVSGDIFGTNKYNLQNQVVVVSNQNSLSTYYLKGDYKIYINVGNSESVFYTCGSSVYLYGISVIGNVLYAYGISDSGSGTISVNMNCYKISLTNGALISSTSISINQFYYYYEVYKGSSWITPNNGNTFIIYYSDYEGSPSGTYTPDTIITWNTGANTISKIPNAITGSTNYKYFFPFIIYSSDGVTPFNGTGCITYDATTSYLEQMNINSNSNQISTYSIGASGLSFTYPCRIIEDTLQYNLGGILVGRLTLEGCPASGTGMEFMNWYGSGGSSLSLETHILNLPAANLQLPSMGNVWAYHTGSNTVALSFVTFTAGRVVASDLYLASIQYGNDNTITTTSATIDSTASWGGSQSIYPVNDYAAWDYELPYYNYGDTYLSYWQHSNGYFPYTSGNLAIEYDNIPFASQTQLWTLSGIQATNGEQPNTNTYQYGNLDYSGGFMNMTVGDFYFIKDTYMSQITITTVGVVLNDYDVNATNNHTFQLLIYTGDTPTQYPNTNTNLLWYGTYNTTQNGTNIYGDLPDAVKQLNQDVRVGIRSLNLNLEGNPLQIGYGSTNAPTRDKANSSFANITTVDFTSDGGIITPPLAIDFRYQGSQGGVVGTTQPNSTISVTGGNGTFILNNTQITTTNINGTQIQQPNSQVGDYIRNLGISNGIGDVVGLLVAIGIGFGFTGAFAYIGKKANMGTGNAFQLMIGIAFVLGFAITFLIGALDLMYFALLLLSVVAFASFKVVSYIAPSNGGGG